MEITPEVKIVNKFFKKMLPFVVEVSDAGERQHKPNHLRLHKSYVVTSKSKFNTLEINIYVSPTHFCELMDYRIEKQVIDRIKLISSQFLKSVFTDWAGDELKILFFPEINEQTILNSPLFQSK